MTIMRARVREGADARPPRLLLSPPLRLPGPDQGLMAGREGGGWDARGGGGGGGFWRGGDRFDSSGVGVGVGGGGVGGGGPPQEPGGGVGGGGGRSREGGDGEGECTGNLFDHVSKYI